MRCFPAIAYCAREYNIPLSPALILLLLTLAATLNDIVRATHLLMYHLNCSRLPHHPSHCSVTCLGGASASLTTDVKSQAMLTDALSSVTKTMFLDDTTLCTIVTIENICLALPPETITFLAQCGLPPCHCCIAADFEHKVFRMTSALARSSTTGHRHGAMVVVDGVIVSQGFNHKYSVRSDTGNGDRQRVIHAEALNPNPAK